MLCQQLLRPLNTAVVDIVKDTSSGIPFINLGKPGRTHMKMLGDLSGRKILIGKVTLDIIPNLCRNCPFFCFFLRGAKLG